MPGAELVLVVAVADNGVIGAAGGMPWHAPEDLRHFRRITIGHPVVMGRRTFAATGKALPGRHNIVLTRDADWRAAGVTAVDSLLAALAAARAGDTGGDKGRDKGRDKGSGAIMIIGGAEIFAMAMPYATRAEITRLHIRPEGDCLWPGLDAGQWEKTASTPVPDATPAMTFESWRRTRGGQAL